MKISILISLIICFCSFSNKFFVTAADQTYRDSVVVKEFGYGKMITHYDNGKKHGREITLLKNGDTMEILQYKFGLLDGKAVNFHGGNKLAVIRYYKEDYQVGEWLHFDTLGNITTKTIFDTLYKYDENLWSGKELFYKMGKPVYTQVWTKGRRSSEIIYDTALYKDIKANDLPLGKKLYMETCSGCHGISRDFIGPALSAPVKTRDQHWLIQFTRNGDEMYKNGDTIAKTLYKQYDYIKHPDYTYLTTGDIEAILKYIREKK